MSKINEEIKLTINMMQTDIDDGAHSELQYHLHQLLEFKRSDLQKSLPVGYWIDDTYNQPLHKMIVEPLTTEELKAGGWWCADVSAECAVAFKAKGLRVTNSTEWGDGEGRDWKGCSMNGIGDATRGFADFEGKKQIHRIGNEFYWSSP